MNGFKTFFLLAAMTGLLVFAGGYLYGEAGVVMGLLFGLMVNAFGYFYSDKIVLARYQVREVTRESHPLLYGIVENLAKRAGLPMPKVGIVPDDTPNAFATGRNPRNALVAVTEGLVNKMDRPELEAVLAHEMAHVKNRDILLGCLAAVLASAIMILSRMAMHSAPRDRQGRQVNPIVALLIVLLAPFAAFLIKMAISRRREFFADESAAKMTGRPDLLASALSKLEEANMRVPMKRAEPATAHMMIVNPLYGSWPASLFRTHPSIEKRKSKLAAMKIQTY